MNNNNLTIPADRSEMLDSLAIVLNDGISIEDAAAQHGTTSTELLALAEQNEVEVNRRAALARADGRAIEGVSKKALSDALRQLADRVNSGDMSAPMLVKVIEVLHKVSGMATKAEKKPEQGRFIFTIHLGGNSDQKISTVFDGETAEVVDDD